MSLQLLRSNPPRQFLQPVMNLLQLLACACVVLFAAAADWPGPKETEMENGVEVWKAKGEEGGDTVYTYKVNDLSLRGARPKLVYNCHKVPALCNNARTSLGGGTTAIRHYDRNSPGGRIPARRGQACPGNWIDTHQCPGPNQPKDFWYYISKEKKFGQREIQMMRKTDKDGREILDRAQFGEERTTLRQDGSTKVSWRKIGAMFTCDEWPAASWIEGGEGANTYCAPQGSSCGKNIKFLKTEQDWQGSAHAAIRTWYDSFYHQWEEDIQDDHNVNYEILKFDFEMVNEPGTKFGTWVEARGLKRYCYPPGNINNDCKKEWDNDPKDLFKRKRDEQS